MTNLPTPKQEPVGKHWLEELQRLFADEFPEPECPAAKAVEGHVSLPEKVRTAQSDRFERVGQ